MELRRVAERKLLLLLRSSTSLGASTRYMNPSKASSRALSTRFPLYSDQPAKPDSEQRTSPATNGNQTGTPSNVSSSTNRSAERRLLDTLLPPDLQSASSKKPRAPFARQPQPPTSPSGASKPDSPTPSPSPGSFDDLMRRINSERTTPESQTQTRTSTLDRPPGRRNSLDIPRTERPTTSSPHSIAAAVLRNLSPSDPSSLQSASAAAIAPPPFRIGPSLGRTVKLDAGRSMDLGRAFRMLDMQVARNRVRSDVNRQRFHERPGLKRKRLRSERWRRRFKEGFQDVVRRVQELRRKGW